MYRLNANAQRALFDFSQPLSGLKALRLCILIVNAIDAIMGL